MCDGPPREDYQFACADCGRALGICADCGFCVRFFRSDSPDDCHGCGYAPLTPAEKERLRPLHGHMQSAIARQFDVLRQMVERSGPIYELARERSRIISEAYRAAGRPRDVTMIRTPEGWSYVHRVGHGHRYVRDDPATEPEWRAWRAWCSERERLRRDVFREPATRSASAGGRRGLSEGEDIGLRLRRSVPLRGKHVPVDGLPERGARRALL